MAKQLFELVVLLIALQPVPVFSQSVEIPKTIRGVEMSSVRGWHANRYAWVYNPEFATVHPVEILHQAGKFQSPGEFNEECKILNESGSGADVLEYNPNPLSPDHKLWSVAIDMPECRKRPRYLLWEHVNGTRYIPENGAKNMDLAINRKRFEEDLDFMFRNFILPNQGRYVTVGGKAVIYLWSVVQMTGNFASLLKELKAKYPVFFIGSINVMALPSDIENAGSFQELDGFMEYTLYMQNSSGEALSYGQVVKMYEDSTWRLSLLIRKFERETGKKYLSIPTFQFAYDDTKIPERKNPPIYPVSRKQVEDFAKSILEKMTVGIYNSVGPFFIWNELYEGAAVIPSKCLPENPDTTSRFVGCGTARLDITKKYFGR